MKYLDLRKCPLEDQEEMGRQHLDRSRRGRLFGWRVGVYGSGLYLLSDFATGSIDPSDPVARVR
jgi:hypothetical protein